MKKPKCFHTWRYTSTNTFTDGPAVCTKCGKTKHIRPKK